MKKKSIINPLPKEVCNYMAGSITDSILQDLKRERERRCIYQYCLCHECSRQVSTSALHSLYLAISEYFNIAFRVWFIYQKPSPKGSLLVRRYAYKYAKLNSNAAESAVVLLFTRNIKSLSTASFFDNSSFFLLKSITVYIFHPINIVTSNDNMPTITPI